MKIRTFVLLACVPLAALVALRLSFGVAASSPSPPATFEAEASPRSRPGPTIEREREADAPGSGATPAEVRTEPTYAQEKALADERDARQMAVLANAFLADTRDAWSAEAERSLRDAFADAPLPGARLDDVRCGATLCRYIVAFDSIEHRDDGIGGAVGLVRWKARGFGDVAPDDPLRYVIYASRDPDRFPAVE